jgi:hypothetical protein
MPNKAATSCEAEGVANVEGCLPCEAVANKEHGFAEPNAVRLCGVTSEKYTNTRAQPDDVPAPP